MFIDENYMQGNNLLVTRIHVRKQSANNRARNLVRKSPRALNCGKEKKIYEIAVRLDCKCSRYVRISERLGLTADTSHMFRETWIPLHVRNRTFCWRHYFHHDVSHICGRVGRINECKSKEQHAYFSTCKGGLDVSQNSLMAKHSRFEFIWKDSALALF